MPYRHRRCVDQPASRVWRLRRVCRNVLSESSCAIRSRTSHAATGSSTSDYLRIVATATCAATTACLRAASVTTSTSDRLRAAAAAVSPLLRLPVLLFALWTRGVLLSAMVRVRVWSPLGARRALRRASFWRRPWVWRRPRVWRRTWWRAWRRTWRTSLVRLLGLAFPLSVSHSCCIESLLDCIRLAPPPETHHDAFMEHWAGKTKAQAIAELGRPTQQTSLSTGESTLLWDHPKGHCSVALHTNKDGKIESGHNSCDTKRSDRHPDSDTKQ
jgi:hypothetical protein